MGSAFETHLDETLSLPADQLAKVTKRMAALAGRLPKATQGGDIRAVDAALRELAALRVEEPLAAAHAAFSSFDARAYLLSDFPTEFAAACSAAGIPLEGHFPNYTVFPFPVRVDVENFSVVINRTRVGALRPGVLASAINAERDRLERSPFNADDFLSALFRMWQRLNLDQSARHSLQLQQPVLLKKVYQELLPFRRWRRDYPETFFAFDVQRLLSSGATEINGYRCQLERGRGSTGALRLVDRQGQERHISTVNFVEA